MYFHGKVCGSLLLVVFFGVLVANAGQASQEVVSPSDSLKERALLFYRTIQKGDRLGAAGLVAPESKNDFLQMNYSSLVEFRILDVHLSDTEDSATVKILRTDKFAGFPQLLDYETIDTWKRVEGQWYMLLPSSEGEVDTPFGKMRFVGQGKDSQAAAPQGLMPLPQEKVDPEQYLRVLQKAIQDENKKRADAKNVEEKKKSKVKKPEKRIGPKAEPQG